MTEITVTVKNKEGGILGEVEMMWDDERFPAQFLELTPIPFDYDLPKIHPAQGKIFVGESR